jgi:hypothetical protein
MRAVTVYGSVLVLPAEVTTTGVPAGRYAATRDASWKSWGAEALSPVADPAGPATDAFRAPA